MATGAGLLALALTLPLLADPSTPAVELSDDLAAVLELESEGRGAEARAALDALLENDPTRPRGRLIGGVLLMREGRRTEAVAVLEALRRDRPDIPETYNNLAVLYGAEGRLDEARELLAEAIERWPGFAVAHENLGEVYANLAHRSWSRARELDADGGRPVAAMRDFALPLSAGDRRPDAFCAIAGGIETRAGAEAAGEWLRARGAATAEVSARAWTVAWHRLYAGPLESRAAAEAMVRDLRERGVRDVGILATDPLASRVSFGVYRNAGNAHRRAEELQRLGYAVEREIEWKPVDGYAVEASGIRRMDALRAAWEAEYSDWPFAAADCG